MSGAASRIQRPSPPLVFDENIGVETSFSIFINHLVQSTVVSDGAAECDEFDLMSDQCVAWVIHRTSAIAASPSTCGVIRIRSATWMVLSSVFPQQTLKTRNRFLVN